MAKSCLWRAIAKQPKYALAWSGLAELYVAQSHSQHSKTCIQAAKLIIGPVQENFEHVVLMEILLLVSLGLCSGSIWVRLSLVKMNSMVILLQVLLEFATCDVVQLTFHRNSVEN
jgi:hypothetical protein